MKAAIRNLLVFAVLAIGLPLAGVAIAGLPVARYLEFPPRTRYVLHAPFSWPAFASGVLLIALLLAPFVRQAVRERAGERPAPAKSRPYPWWGWLGAALGAVAWLFAWTRIPWFAPFQAHTFTPQWIAYILAVSALTFRRTGRCFMTDRPRVFLMLFAASAGFWWLFEYLNRFVQNWYYLDTGEYGPWEYFWLATLPFSTVLPAVFATREWLGSHPLVNEPFRRFLPLEIRAPKRAAWGALALSSAGMAGIGVWPDLLFPLLWVSPLLVIVSLQVLRGEPHVLSGLPAGDWRDAVSFAAAGLVCGFFWELWNWKSLAKWVYAIPYMDRFRLFEMPLLGYSGYLPFGLECAAVAGLLIGIANGGKPSKGDRATEVPATQAPPTQSA